ncbi:unnamed protein product (macronuclear) [Paramecium tetraurelia]|uniref:Uncharacterized protein n=1 Tax=Paramecium tetraurelia TaxID=5888 RepID=A0BYK1_PARTE|nr:uncharacterized protein GSPATT00033471001 [Paramecium tetraurelia]CAK63618.1 unnamed protein product [Paramecium tetraurelia]|eukprot:XP_001431016.1 hypothetical protein (macronuclear) [Paramecium tetraurelia strain d4-2]
MGCICQKETKQQEIKQYDQKLQQIVTVPVLYDPKTNPIMKRRLQQDAQSEQNRTPTRF